MAKDSHLRNHLEVHSPSFDQVFLLIQLKTFLSSVDGLLIFFFFTFELFYSLLHILMIKSSYRVDGAIFNFLSKSFEIL